MKITKVYLKEFIESLIFAYNRGADFADIIKEGEEITIAVKEEYMNKDEGEEQEDYTQINEMLLKKLMN